MGSLSAPVVGSTTTGLRWWVGREPLGLEEVVQFEKKFLYWRVTNIPTFLYYYYNIISILSQRDCMSIYTTVLGHILIQIWCRGVPFLEMVTLLSTGTDITEWTVPTDLRVPIFTNTCYQGLHNLLQLVLVECRQFHVFLLVLR